MTSFPETLPAARTPPSEAAPTLRWGVLGTGWIAERFIGSLRRHTRQRLLAVGSRDAGRSAAFADRHGLPRAYGSYEELVADPTSTSPTSPPPTRPTIPAPGWRWRPASTPWWRSRWR
jgi:hypothetical protein